MFGDPFDRCNINSDCKTVDGVRYICDKGTCVPAPDQIIPGYPKTIRRSPHSLEVDNYTQEGAVKEMLGLIPGTYLGTSTLDWWLSYASQSTLDKWKERWIEHFEDYNYSEGKRFVNKMYDEYSEEPEIPGIPEPEEKKPAGFEIESTPSGAEVVINDVKQFASTPGSFLSTSGTNNLILNLAGYKSHIKSYTLAANEIKKLNIVLEKAVPEKTWWDIVWDSISSIWEDIGKRIDKTMRDPLMTVVVDELGEPIVVENADELSRHPDALNFLSIMFLGKDLSGTPREVPELKDSLDFFGFSTLAGIGAVKLTTLITKKPFPKFLAGLGSGGWDDLGKALPKGTKLPDIFAKMTSGDIRLLCREIIKTNPPIPLAKVLLKWSKSDAKLLLRHMSKFELDILFGGAAHADRAALMLKIGSIEARAISKMLSPDVLAGVLKTMSSSEVKLAFELALANVDDAAKIITKVQKGAKVLKEEKAIVPLLKEAAESAGTKITTLESSKWAEKSIAANLLEASKFAAKKPLTVLGVFGKDQPLGKVFKLLVAIVGVDGIMTWLASDNIVTGSGFMINKLKDAVEEGVITQKEALEEMDKVQEWKDYATNFINVSTIANPLLWLFRKILLINTDQAQLSIDTERKIIAGVSIEIPEKIEVTVSNLVDGDTIDVRREYTTIGGAYTIPVIKMLPEYKKTGHARVRIVGIDTPEKTPKGEIHLIDIGLTKVPKHWTDDARTSLLYLDEKKVILETDPENPMDSYGRILAVVKYSFQDIGLQQIKEGLASYYFVKKHKYVDDDLYLSETKKARENKVGFWKDIAMIEFKIKITSSPTNARIYVDGTPARHNTPSDEVELSDVMDLFTEGKHIIKVEKGGLTSEKEVNITAGDNGIIHFVISEEEVVTPDEVPGEVPEEELPPEEEREILFSIESNPSNAKVWIDEVYTRHLTPTNEKEQKDMIHLWTPGTHRLRVTRKGYSRDMDITLVKGERFNLTLELEGITAPPAPPIIVPPTEPPEKPPEEIPPVEIPANVIEFYEVLKTYYEDRMYLSKKELIELGIKYGLDISGL